MRQMPHIVFRIKPHDQCEPPVGVGSPAEAPLDCRAPRPPRKWERRGACSVAPALRGSARPASRYKRRRRRPVAAPASAPASPGAKGYAAVAAVALASYANALGGDFVHDDIPAVTRNKDVLGLTPLPDVFRNDFWGTPMADASSHKSYRPLTTLTFRATYWLVGAAPAWFHASNVLLHAAASLLFARACCAVAGLAPAFAALAGVIFAAHPVHTEAVTGIVGRADVLACVFLLLSLLAYHGREQPRLWTSVLLAALSMLAKETGVAALLVNLLFDAYRSWSSLKKSLVEARCNTETVLFSRRAAKLLMALSALLVFRLALLQGSLPRFSSQDNPAAFHPSRLVRFLTFCYLAAFNCWLLLCPATLSHDWQMGSVPLVTQLSDSRNLATAVFFLCSLAVVYRGLSDLEHQRPPAVFLSVLLLALPFLPATNLLLTVGFVVAERVLYMPSLGAVLAACYGAQLLWAGCGGCRARLCAVGAASLLLAAAFCGRSLLRNRDWASRETLVRAGLRALPHNAKMHYNLANVLRDAGNADLAAEHYREALRLWPTYASAHNNLGTLLRADEAEAHFLAAIRHAPGHVHAHYNLGQLYRRDNRTEDAAVMLERCIRLDSGYTPAYLLLARLYAGAGLQARVGELLRQLVRLQPLSADRLADYGDWLLQQGRRLEALQLYQRALAVSCTHRAALLGAARILRSQGQLARVHQLLLRSLAMSPQHRGGLVYTGDLLLRSWQLGSAYHQENVPSHPPRNADDTYREHEATPARQPPERPKTSRRAGASDKWRRRAPSRNRTLVLRPGSAPRPGPAGEAEGVAAAAAAAGAAAATAASRPLWLHHVGQNSGTAVFHQGYHYSYWSEEHFPPLSLPTEEDFSTELTTG
ncbi:protein O-mannosyl-transferase TMTC1-like [Schistocerca serialis cubense]|uniref:protein O-mannosyl-transferase TMTC1-like n=1 Tax=Schistocerca serialis cubense TaxID=2023355 RepID=UPI00214ED0A7|nr:protein O-mannosyl-transferase TMTC1-like [Schistocerca serialis cubense]